MCLSQEAHETGAVKAEITGARSGQAMPLIRS
jgi:hypothetical protein